MAKSDTISLDQFTAITKNEVEAFKNHWGAERSKDPKNWPLEMSEGDWFEQFLAFLSTQGKIPDPT